MNGDFGAAHVFAKQYEVEDRLIRVLIDLPLMRAMHGMNGVEPFIEQARRLLAAVSADPSIVGMDSVEATIDGCPEWLWRSPEVSS